MKLYSYYIKTSLWVLFLLPVGLMLNGCATNPHKVIIAPELATTSTIFHRNKQAQLKVADMRTASHIVQIKREGKASTLISAQEKLEDTIEKTLKEHWQAQHLVIMDSALNKIHVTIEKAIISVEQSLLKYSVQTEIVVKVTVNNGSVTLTNTFTNRGNSEGPLKADVAVLERQFNQGLANLLQQILTSTKISNALK